MLTLSGTELRRRLAPGLEIPEWFTFPDIRRTYPPRHLRASRSCSPGFRAQASQHLPMHCWPCCARAATDVSRCSTGTSCARTCPASSADREINLRRIGFVASEVTRHGGIAICAPIAPYAATRQELRETIEAVGGFVEVHVSTEAHDRKGLCATARAGLIKGFTGIDDPCELPENPDIAIDTSDLAAHRIFVKLETLGFIR